MAVLCHRADSDLRQQLHSLSTVCKVHPFGLEILWLHARRCLDHHRVPNHLHHAHSLSDPNLVLTAQGVVSMQVLLLQEDHPDPENCSRERTFPPVSSILSMLQEQMVDRAQERICISPIESLSASDSFLLRKLLSFSGASDGAVCAASENPSSMVNKAVSLSMNVAAGHLHTNTHHAYASSISHSRLVDDRKRIELIEDLVLDLGR